LVMSLGGRLPFDKVPEWAEVRSLPLDEQIHRLQDPEVRKRLVWAAYNGDYGRPLGAEARKPTFDNLFVFDTPIPPHDSVEELGRRRGVDPVEALIDHIVERGPHALFLQPTRRYAHGRDDFVEVMQHPHSVMTFSDSGAHVSQICDASIHTHLLAYWVREM